VLHLYYVINFFINPTSVRKRYGLIYSYIHETREKQVVSWCRRLKNFEHIAWRFGQFYCTH